METNFFTDILDSVATLGITGLCIGLVVIVVGGAAWLTWKGAQALWQLCRLVC